MTDRVLRAIANPHVDILGHPTGRMILKRAASARGRGRGRRRRAGRVGEASRSTRSLPARS